MGKGKYRNTGFKCPICNEYMYYVLRIHAEKHGLTLEEYVKKYPKSRKFLVDKKLVNIVKKIEKLDNLEIKEC